ncbi:hypothetical protein ACVWZ6_004706 [Bradyrhizobium sp. GM6.1]
MRLSGRLNVSSPSGWATMRSANTSACARMASRCSWSISELSSQNSTSGRKIATTATATMCRNTMRQISDLNVGDLPWIPARNPA